MASIERMKANVKKLFETNPMVHLNVHLTNPKLVLENTEAKIIGVYPHIFQIEEYTHPQPKTHILQYSDLLISRIVILELEPPTKE